MCLLGEALCFLRGVVNLRDDIFVELLVRRGIGVKGQLAAEEVLDSLG